jgi:diguanylate cyclase (GGDEF)-like protein
LDNSKRFTTRFIAAVIAPVLVVAVGLSGFAVSSLHTAAQQADRVSAQRQANEVKIAVERALDELAQSEAGVAVWDPTVLQLGKPRLDMHWFDDNIGGWLHRSFGHDGTYILDGADRPVYAMVEGKRMMPEAFDPVAAAAGPLVDAARGILRPRPNRHERLPGQPVGTGATLRTSGRAIHATDLVSVAGRPALMSVMRIVPDSNHVKPLRSPAPLMVSVRYLDTGLTNELAKVQAVTGARVATDAVAAADEYALALTSGSGKTAGYLVWRPDRPGDSVWRAMAPSAGFVLTALMAILGGLTFGVAKLMRRDARSLEQLNAAHVELKAREGQAHHLAYHDALTGLPNRAYFNAMGDQLVAAPPGPHHWAVLLIDLDRFKQVNDTLGHLGGDLLIRLVGDRLRELVSADDVVARVGGDEYAVLLCERGSEEEIASVAGDMVGALRAPFEVLGTRVFIGASIGIACVPGCDGDRSDLMRMADIAMYRTKAEGRDGFRFFTADMDESVKLRQEIEDDLRRAMEDKRQLFVQYQPQMDVSGTRIVGLEALLRWRHPARGLLAPQLFIPIAEETGLIRELGTWILREACTVAATWPGLSMAVNLSPAQFRCHGIAEEIMAIVRDAGVAPQQIEFEVTEGILLADDEPTKEALAELRNAGFRIALDDFGTGYSSLSYLSRFKVDKIKIDQSFTSRLGDSTDATAIVQAVVRLGHAMGLTVSAEGVETDQQRTLLEVAGCNELQGFLFSAAVSSDELADLLRRPRRVAMA